MISFLQSHLDYGAYNFNYSDNPRKNKSNYKEINDIKYILHALLNPWSGTFEKLGIRKNISYEPTLFDKDALINCKNDNCNFDHGKEIVWESKSVVNGSPRAIIYGHFCKCNSNERLYELDEYEYENIKDKNIENLFYEYFVSALPKRASKDNKSIPKKFKDKNLASPQSKIAAKLMAAKFQNVKPDFSNPKHRQSKKLLNNTLEQIERAVQFWPDMADVYVLNQTERKVVGDD